MKPLALAAVALVACSDVPSRERFPGGHGRTTDVQQAQTSREVLGGASTVPVETHDAAPRRADGPTLTGRVSLGAGLKAPAGALLYIAVRKKGVPGPPLAARRVPNASLPYEFSLSGADAMMEGTVFEGEVEITARLDQDGDPLSRQPGDVQGVKNAKVGDSGLKIVLDQLIE